MSPQKGTTPCFHVSSVVRHRTLALPMTSPIFPNALIFPQLSDQEAEAALALLRSLVEQDRASVYTRPYTPEGARPRWNVWDLTSGEGRRVELEPWAMGVLSLRAACEDPKSPIGATA